MTAVDDATGEYPMPATVALAALLSIIADVANAERLHGYVSQFDWARIVAAAGRVSHGH